MESESYQLDRVLKESRSSHSSHTAQGDTDGRPFPRASISAEGQERIIHLARRLTTQSVSRNQTNDALPNPFIDGSDPRLDPQSDQFDAARWARLFLQLSSADPEKYPRRKAGVSFRNLSVSGVGNPIAYQQTFAGIIQQPLDIALSLLHPRDRSIQILKQHDGLVRSKEMLLVLGRPGSGVSTLLKTISGETRGLSLDSSSHLNYQGIPQHTMHREFRGDAIYQAETEVHFPQLTVGQTLQFAALAKTPRNRLPGISRETYAAHLRDVAMAVFGISHTLNTRVGDDFIRGVSGGERKRVSIAEVALAQSPIQCWDNSTRGLDSATAVEFVRTIRLSVDIVQTAAIVSLYQAPQQAYDLFDKVTVLYDGRQIYFGPIDQAEQYFVNLGYHRPDRQTVPDFLTSVTSPAERRVRPGFESQVPRTADEFAARWHESDLAKAVLNEIASFEEQYPEGGPSVDEFRAARQTEKATLMTPKSPYTISVPQQVALCVRRGYQRIMGDKTFFIVTVFGNFLMALLLGSVFYDLPDDTSSLNNRCILLFFALLFNALNSSLEILSLYTQRPIVEKHNSYAFYHPLSEALASVICDLPSKFLSTLALNIPLYFMGNLNQSAGAFFTYLLFGITSTLTMSSIFRTIGQATQTIAQALTPVALFVIGLVIYAGFILPIRNMQGWLRWINYIIPLAYSYEAMVANEFHGRNFPCTSLVPAGPGYEDVSNLDRTCSIPGAVPGGSDVAGDAYVAASYEYQFSHVWRNFGILIGYIVFFTCAYILVAEYIVPDKPRGEVLLFQRGHRQVTHEKAQRDEESATEPRHVGEESINAPPPYSKEARQINLQKQSGVLHWKDVCYEVSIKGQPRLISDHIDGWVRPGTLTALMGASGAGKTTLLDVLANRVTTGVITGDICVNGRPRDLSFQRQVGYVQQQDLHLQTTTVREALQFSACLRQPSHVPMQEKMNYVEEIIALLEMEAYSGAVVGVPGEGLNVEQRKRLTIGVELAAKPDLLIFLDEPTSGLDSQTAWSISTLLRRLADHGQAILCTIHQPSAMLFQQFDRLLLLAKGGRTVYFGDIGENSRTMVDYFERHGAEPCAPEANPAEWMLHVIGAAPGSTAICDWPETWKSSPEFAQIRNELERLENSNVDSVPEAEGPQQQYAAPFHTQVFLCTRRVFEQYWRTPSYLYSKLILCFGTALFIGLSFLQTEVTLMGLQHQMFAIFMLLVIFAFLAYQTMPNFIMQRDLYEARERPSKVYSWSSFMLANILVELPWNTLAAVITFLPFYYLIGMDKNAEVTDTVTERGGLMVLLIWSFMMHCATFTSMVVAGAPTAEVGAIIALIMYCMCLIFCGVMVPSTALPGFWIFMYRVSPLTYLISGMLSAGLAKTPVTCNDVELVPVQPANGQNCADYLAAYMQVAGGEVYNPNATENCQFCPMASSDAFLASVGSDYGDRWRNFGLMWVYILFNVAAAVALYWLLRVPKSREGTRRTLGNAVDSLKRMVISS
ncbi:ABC-2 type transporter-domain-containing protein [Aspergillus pseudodeflectus]|uniref:ABC-2 type transporter-domain-containing protein n=1 Tax=Aspergillus pseudodeflectus TaxID=176178 RepID=A0ABR4K4E4_9EURO